MNTENSQNLQQFNQNIEDLLSAILYKLGRLEATQNEILPFIYKLRTEDGITAADAEVELRNKIDSAANAYSFSDGIIPSRATGPLEFGTLEDIERKVSETLNQGNEHGLYALKNPLEWWGLQLRKISHLKQFAVTNLSTPRAKELLLRVTRLELDINNALSVVEQHKPQEPQEEN